MRCDLCPLWPAGIDDVCPEMEGEYGIVHKGGVCGCRHPWNWVKKRDEEYTAYLGRMGEEMGKELDKRASED